MTDRLTDEEVREMADEPLNFDETRVVAAELLALRARCAKLEAALREARADVCDWLDSEYHLPRAADLLDRIDAALAQPAESESSHD